MSDTVNNNNTTSAPTNSNNAEVKQNVASTENVQSAQPQSAHQPNAQPENTVQSNDSDAELASVYDTNQQAQPEQPQPQIPEDYQLTGANGAVLEGNNYTEFKNIFKGAKLTQEQAQQMYSAYEQSINNVANAQQQAIKKMRADWASQVKSDNELGGQNFNNTKMNIGRVMEKFGNSELKKFLNDSGLGLNPSFVRFINKVGQAIGNDTAFVNGKGGAPTQQQLNEEFGKKMYPNSPELWSVKR